MIDERDKTHFDGTWGCGSSSGKRVKNWSHVSCPDCHNSRKNSEISLQSAFASALLSGEDLSDLQKKMAPDNFKFEKTNYSTWMREVMSEMKKISRQTSKLKTLQARYDFVKNLVEKHGKTDATYSVLVTAGAFLSKHYVDLYPIQW